MTQPGETDGFTVSQHVETILKHSKYPNMIDTVIVNDQLPQSLVDEYRAANSVPVILDKENLDKLGVNIEIRRLTENNQKLVRHSSYKLSRAIYAWYKKSSSAKGVNDVQKKYV